MKRLVAILIIVGLAAISFAAAPTNNSTTAAGTIGTTSITIDSQWTGTWKLIDSIDIVVDDTGYIYVTCEATATLTPGKVIYLGLLNGKGNPTTAPQDTVKFAYPIGATDQSSGIERASVTIPFVLSLLDSTDTQTDSTFIVYFTGAVGGSTAQEQVALSSVSMTATVYNRD